MTFLDLLLDFFDLFHLNSHIPFFLLYLCKNKQWEMYRYYVVVYFEKEMISYALRKYLASGTSLHFFLIRDFWGKNSGDQHLEY